MFFGAIHTTRPHRCTMCRFRLWNIWFSVESSRICILRSEVHCRCGYHVRLLDWTFTIALLSISSSCEVTYWRGYLSSQSRPSAGEGPPSTETIDVVRGRHGAVVPSVKSDCRTSHCLGSSSSFHRALRRFFVAVLARSPASRWRRLDAMTLDPSLASSCVVHSSPAVYSRRQLVGLRRTAASKSTCC